MSLSDLRRNLSDLALGGLPADLRRQAENVTEAYILTERGMRRVAVQIQELNDRRAIMAQSQLSELTSELRGVKAQQDLANSKLEALIDACNARAVDDDTADVLRGILSAFVEGIGEADSAMQQAMAVAAARHRIPDRR
jgi:hypothetical protein